MMNGLNPEFIKYLNSIWLIVTKGWISNSFEQPNNKIHQKGLIASKTISICILLFTTF